ncbi:hypothetical protein SAMN05216368_1154 [Cryobacterium flavum]|nr:DUF6338 family protein [Cryobacterium flavum]SDO31626.1 hypothetical protein SAMN05216368_1154 [Cryobacterium flavum]
MVQLSFTEIDNQLLTVLALQVNEGIATMEIPGSSFAVAALIVLAFPGIMFAGIRRCLRGEMPEDRNIGLALARGVVLSVVLTACYLVIFGSWEGFGVRSEGSSQSVEITDARSVGLVVLILYVLAPLVIAVVFHHRYIRWVAPKTPVWAWLKFPQSSHGYTMTPAAWDFAASANSQAFVRIHRANGDWIGGWYTRGSYTTTYPEPTSIYISNQFRMNDDGTFGDLLPNTGVWVAISETDVVSWQTMPDVPNK